MEMFSLYNILLPTFWRIFPASSGFKRVNEGSIWYSSSSFLPPLSSACCYVENICKLSITLHPILRYFIIVIIILSFKSLFLPRVAEFIYIYIEGGVCLLLELYILIITRLQFRELCSFHQSNTIDSRVCLTRCLLQ